MEEFLKRVAMTGQMRNKVTNLVELPPQNLTDWNGQDVKVLKEWLRNVTHTPLWSPGSCLAAFPQDATEAAVNRLHGYMEEASKNPLKNPILQHPPPVDSSPLVRLRENLAGRRQLCIYDTEMQSEPVIHFMCYHKMRVRMLVHFYAFLYFEDYREDLWMKRFMRDHIRYKDPIQCAAARIVAALRKEFGDFDTFHIRRGDFQFKRTRIEAKEIYNNVKDVLPEGRPLFIATDERDKKFFDPLKQHYEIRFLDDYKHLLDGVNTNFYGMIDQLVASKGKLFFGC
uniref:O-fucosyltransferase family protein n=1 Tax=Amphora coffeiformis TaxID=265554 RepID=A0A7S3P737_9STRA